MTVWLPCFQCQYTISIHTTRKVVTWKRADSAFNTVYFNPHHPQGGDCILAKYDISQLDFNPHHPQGGDAFLICSYNPILISIHTTRKVVTQFSDFALYRKDFNPHHPQGGDISANHLAIFPRISIHTTRKVVTRYDMHNVIEYGHFNPHHPQGGDTICQCLKFARRHFNPHHPQGGD